MVLRPHPIASGMRLTAGDEEEPAPCGPGDQQGRSPRCNPRWTVTTSHCRAVIPGSGAMRSCALGCCAKTAPPGSGRRKPPGIPQPLAPSHGALTRTACSGCCPALSPLARRAAGGAGLTPSWKHAHGSKVSPTVCHLAHSATCSGLHWALTGVRKRSQRSGASSHPPHLQHDPSSTLTVPRSAPKPASRFWHARFRGEHTP